MKLREGLDLLKSYSSNEAEWQIKLDANERPYNLPPIVDIALRDRLANLQFNRYPEITAHSLRKNLADSFNLAVEQIQIGNGSSELLAALCYAFGGSGRQIVYPNPSFSMYPVYARLSDSEPAPVQLNADYTLPVEVYLSTARTASLAILCNPNNPTGIAMPVELVDEIAGSLSCPLVVDEAYFEFHQRSASKLLSKHNNLVIVRTFSKAYGLAAARVGYMLASQGISSAIGKVLLPYHVNALSLIAAEVTFAHRSEFDTGINQTIAERVRLSDRLRSIPGIEIFPSETNFLLIRANDATQLAARFAKAGIGIRDFSQSPGLNGCIRVTVGTPKENDAVIAICKGTELATGGKI